jgi:hypothetical protein
VRIEPEDFDAARHGILLRKIETRRGRHAAREHSPSDQERESC